MPIKQLIPLVIVLGLSLLLLVYVGYSDASNSFAELQLEKLASEAEIIQNRLEGLFQAGLPLNQIVGFKTLTQPALDSDPDIDRIEVVDPRGNTVYFNSRTDIETAEDAATNTFGELIELGRDRYAVYRSGALYQVRFPLRSRFEQVAELRVSQAVSSVQREVNERFLAVLIVMVLLIIIYCIVYYQLVRKKKLSPISLNISYIVTFLAMALFLLLQLVTIYSTGIQLKTKALADNLASRLNAALDIGLSIEDFDGLGETFANYQMLNPDIRYIVLTKDNEIQVHTDPELVGNIFRSMSSDFEYVRTLNSDDDQSRLLIGVAIPRAIITTRLLRNVKNFAVLFISAIFMAWLFLRILFSFYQETGSSISPSTTTAKLDLIYPVFFLANFMEGMLTSFLPQYLRELAVSSGYSPGAEAAVFSTFFVAYALILIPAGNYAQRQHGIRYLLLGGFSLYVISMLLMVMIQDFRAMYPIRFLAGLGQGMTFIAVQSYILFTAKERMTTQGVSIIVYGYNGGIISGVNIGGLLVSSLRTRGIFFLNVCIGVLIIWYIVILIRSERAPASQGTSKSFQTIGEALRKQLGSIWSIIKDGEFIKTIIFVGIITKSILTGVVLFALPLFLESRNYLQEDIAQIIMFYAAGVLLVSRYISRTTDRIGNTRLILFLGAIGSGIGLALIGLIPSISSTLLVSLLLIFALLLVGLSHGFIHAPIVTHITMLHSSQVLGKASTTSMYRFLERIGHVIGPIVVNALILLRNQTAGVISLIGMAVIVSGLLFMILPRKKQAEKTA